MNESLPKNKTESSKGRLLRVLGVGFGVAVIIGNTVGAGILRTPGEIASLLPNSFLFIGAWVAGGLYALLGAVSIAELGTMLPRSGGQYVFVRRGFGDYAGFVVGWSDWLSTCGSTASVAIVIGTYLAALFPVLSSRVTTAAIVVTILFAIFQWKSVALGSGVQKVITAAKAVVLVGFILAALYYAGVHGRTDAPAPVGSTAILSISFSVAVIRALQSVIYTYDGWTGVIYFSEEVQNPGRNIPRSLFLGVFLVIGIYLLINIALMCLMPLTGFAGSDLAVGTASDLIFGRYGDTVIRSLVVISLLSSINAFHLMASRVLYAMAVDGLFFEAGKKVNRGGTPTTTLLISIIAAVLFILSGTFDQVLGMLAFFFVANYTLSFSTLFILRRREPDLPRPYRAWGYPYTTGIALIVSVCFLAGAVNSDPRNSGFALILLIVSYPIFWILKRGRRVSSRLN